MSKSHFDSLVRVLSAQYGDTLGPFLARRVGRAMKGRDCVDNFRVCDLAEPAEVKAYESALAAGCCGFFDAEIEHYASGRRFRYGFNFGH